MSGEDDPPLLRTLLPFGRSVWWRAWDGDERDPTGDDRRSGGESAPGEGTEFQFLTGPVREGIDSAPEIVVTIAAGFFIVAELDPGVEGASAVLPRLGVVVPVDPTSVAVTLGVGGLWVALLVGLLRHVGLLRLSAAMKVTGLIGAVAGLSLGTLASVVLVLTSEDPTSLPPNAVYMSGYLLMLLVGGWYIRDSMAYTEALLNRLEPQVEPVGDAELPERGDVEPSPDGDPSPYERFTKDLNETLRDSFGSVRSAHLFAVLVVLPFAWLWWTGSGPQNLGAPATSATAFLSYALNLAFDLVIAVIAFQFIVLVTFVYDLITGSYTLEGGGRLELRYDLQNPDECAGLSGLGDFAMRVNLLLLLASVYLVYRLYVQGLRVLPPGTILEHADAVPYGWLLNYVAPVFIFTAVVGVWLYYSFWQLHRKMARDRRAIVDGWPEVVDDGPAHIDIREDDWHDAREAPVWPIDSRQLLPLIVVNGVPSAIVLVEGVQLL